MKMERIIILTFLLVILSSCSVDWKDEMRETISSQEEEIQLLKNLKNELEGKINEMKLTDNSEYLESEIARLESELVDIQDENEKIMEDLIVISNA